MGNVDRILMLKLLGDTSSMDKALRKEQGRLKSFGTGVAKWGTAALESLAIDGFERLADAVGNAWDGFRSGQRVADQLGVTWQNLHKDGARLDGTLQAIYDSTLALGTSDDEAVQAFNGVLKATGDSREAMRRLRIAQDLVANGSAPNLKSALKLIQQASDGSKRAVTQFGLHSKTAAGRVKELGEKVKGAAQHAADLDPLGVLFNSINEDLEGIVGSLSGGDIEGALQSLGQIGTDLQTTWSKVYGPIAAVMEKLSGGQRKNQLGLPSGSTFSDIASGVGGLLGKLSDLADTVLPKVKAGFDTLTTLWDTIAPHVQTAVNAIQPLIDAVSTSLSGGLGFVLDLTRGAMQLVIDLLKGDFTGAFDGVKTTVGNLATDVNDFFVGLPAKLLNILPDLADAADQVGGTIFDGIVHWIKDMANRVVEVWNSLGAYPPGSVHIFDGGSFGIKGTPLYTEWGPFDISWGAGDLIPNIPVPQAAKGGIVPRRRGGTLVNVGEGRSKEAIVPLDGKHGMGDTYVIHQHFGPGTDPAAAGRAVLRVIQAASRQDGGVGLAAALRGTR